MSELLILRGVPASGKSSVAIQLQELGYVRVNRDDIRFALFGSYWGEGVDENMVTVVEDKAISDALSRGRDVVLDATNLDKKRLKTKLSIASRWGAEVNFHDFPVSLAQALAWNAGRDRNVPEKAIRQFYKRYRIDEVNGLLPPAPSPLPIFEPYKNFDLNTPAFIVDTDGTVANNEPHRSPHDTSKYHLDTPINRVVSVVQALDEYGYTIIGLSGRDEAFRAVTEKWWAERVGVTPDLFLMRPKGDTRMDAIVKYELFKQYIEPNYHVLGAFDDRPQVIRMWQAIGVPVFDVGTGEEF